MIRYTFTLLESEKIEIIKITQKGKHSSTKSRNAYILLNADNGNPHKQTTKEIADFLHIGTRTVERVKKLFVEEGFEPCLNRNKRNYNPKKKVNVEIEAHLIALCCSEAPQGFARWSLRLLADKMVELNYVDSISHETVRRVLKKRIKALES